MKCAACRVPDSIACAHEARRWQCDQPGGPYFGAHATGGDDLVFTLFPEAFTPRNFSQGKSPVDLTTFLRRRSLVQSCDYRGPQSQCGCTETHVCFLGNGDVTLDTCLACVAPAPR